MQWIWGSKEEASFEHIKVALVSIPVLRILDFERQFIITIDASYFAMGATMEQNFGQGLQPIAFASCKLSNAETHYSAYKHELLGIV